LDNSQTDNDSDTDLQNLTQKTPPRTDRNQPNANTLDEPNNNPYYITDKETDNTETPSSTYRLLATIPMHLHTTFQTLNNLKEKQIKTNTTLENLTTHKTDGTLPNNLNKTTDCQHHTRQRPPKTLGASIQRCRLQTTRHLTRTTKTETYKYKNKNNTRQQNK
jgi:hypothetical protein